MAPTIQVSYLVAVRNKVRTIGRCLNSVLKQGVDEIIVVDGWSTDGTSELIDRFPVIHLYDPVLGLAAARNEGFERCTGEYVVIIDGDQWLPEGFDRELRSVLGMKRWDAVFLNEVWVGNSTWAKARQQEWVLASTFKYDRLYRPKVFRVSVLRAVGGWDEEFTSFEDADLWNRVKELEPATYRSKITICSDASDLSPASEFRRGIWYGSKLALFLRRHPSQWEESTSVAPFGFLIDLLLAARIFASTRSIRIAIAALVLRMAKSVGWFVGILLHR